MRRRTLLSALGATILTGPGCLGKASPGALASTTDTPTPRKGERTVRVTGIDSRPSDAPLVPRVTVLRPRVTTDQPARISVTVTNTTAQPVWNLFVRIPAFSEFITHESTAGHQLLLLKPNDQYATIRPGCWRAALSEPQLQQAYTDVVTDIRYAPGGTMSTAFDIYGHPANTGPCLPPGEYPIDVEYSVSDDSNTETAEWEYRWGFTLGVTDA